MAEKLYSVFRVDHKIVTSVSTTTVLKPRAYHGISDVSGELEFAGDPDFKGGYLVTVEKIPGESTEDFQEYVKKLRGEADAFGRKYRSE